MLPSHFSAPLYTAGTYASPALTTLLLRQESAIHKSRTQLRRLWWWSRLWSSYLDYDCQAQITRRNRWVRHRYVAAVLRQKAWENVSPMKTQRYTWRLCSLWSGEGTGAGRPGGRF